MVQIALLGHGVVGSGVAQIILTHTESLKKRAGKEINLKYILDLREFPESPFADRFTKDFNDIVNDDEVKVVVEVLGGLNPAYNFVKECLLKGKSVVTSNKELVAAKGAELLQIAKDKNVNFLFEASVGGGIPIIRPISQCLAANEVYEIAGILNGTTNFILTKMINEKMEFSKALTLAQELGYAEKDPTADVEGHDAIRKICILASLTFGRHVYPENLYTKGISQITLEDVAYANVWGGVIKLIGKVKVLEDGKLDIFVSPMFVSNESQLSSVNDVFNGILVRGDSTGDVVFYGKGAGKMPTASAVVADVIDCVKHMQKRKDVYWADSDNSFVIDNKYSKTKMYVRCLVNDKEKDVKTINEIFGDVTYLSRKGEKSNEIAFATNEEIEFGLFEEKINSLKEKNIEVVTYIRIGDI